MRTGRLFLHSLILMTCLSIPYLIASAQDEYRVVHLLYPNNCPAKIGELQVAEKPIERQKPFAAGKDWLRSLSWEVENIGEKSAAYLEIDLDFHELDRSGDRVFKYQYGRGVNAPDNLDETKLLRPGQRVRMIISDDDYVRIMSFVNERQLNLNVSIVEMKIAKVVFEDGTTWPPN